MSTHFISDLHLDASNPDIIQEFLSYLHTRAKEADSLYILGDLFEVWIGDDDETALTESIAQELHALIYNGVPIFYLHGNRDFLLGEAFAKKAGIEILPDPWVVDVHGIRTLLTHGDTLCTEDTRYLEVRARYRTPFYKKLFLALPLFIRKAITKHLRNKSKKHTRTVSMNIMDATHSEIEKLMINNRASILIHGHTHRPSIHYFSLNEKWVSRFVLSDWDKTGNVLIFNKDGTQRLIYL
jgi:UDP-2,3-diacylglucosamine hydrolase